jgi:hypothetical protein
MRVDNWDCRAVEPEHPRTCVACRGQIPNPDVAWGDLCYSPIWFDDADGIYARSKQVFGLEDPITEFVICKACFTRMNMPSPGLFIEAWIEEDRTLVDREKNGRW